VKPTEQQIINDVLRRPQVCFVECFRAAQYVRTIPRGTPDLYQFARLIFSGSSSKIPHRIKYFLQIHHPVFSVASPQKIHPS
jgi:hypothetical protein